MYEGQLPNLFTFTAYCPGMTTFSWNLDKIFKDWSQVSDHLADLLYTTKDPSKLFSLANNFILSKLCFITSVYSGVMARLVIPFGLGQADLVLIA